MKTLFSALLLTFMLIACQKEAIIVPDGNTDLIGSWIKPQYVDSVITYERAENLLENSYGFTFKPGNKLIARQNSGWCGTPPISTTDYEGSWIQNGSEVKITMGYWGGTSIQTWKIVSLDQQKLVIYISSSKYQQGK
ncbi:MAG: hypothetical protein U0Z17_03640 [Bacteroidales bacterium]